MPSVPWTTSIADLRTFLSDGATDKFCRRKKFFGKQDSTNTSFYTFEFRRTTDFTAPATIAEGVFVNGSRVTAASDDLTSGFFTVTGGIANTATIEASYYYQWFTDAELQGFVQNAMLWLGFGTDPTTIPAGLIPAALHYAAKDAYFKMAIRWRDRLSSSFQLEDAPRKEALEVATGFESLSKDTYQMADKLASNYYTRQHQSEQPYFNIAYGRVRSVTPRR